MFYIMIAIIICAADLGIKAYMDKKKDGKNDTTIMKGNIILTKYYNKGAFLNVLEKKKNVLLIISGALLGFLFIMFGILLPKKNNHLLKLGYSFVIGGACSNVYDRIKKGHVVDYFSFSFLKRVVFNIADMFIFLGTLIIALVSLFKSR